jgi:hypothetical protein
MPEADLPALCRTSWQTAFTRFGVTSGRTVVVNDVGNGHGSSLVHAAVGMGVPLGGMANTVMHCPGIDPRHTANRTRPRPSNPSDGAAPVCLHAAV